jgi:hypothetical protein
MKTPYNLHTMIVRNSCLVCIAIYFVANVESSTLYNQHSPLARYTNKVETSQGLLDKQGAVLEAYTINITLALLDIQEQRGKIEEHGRKIRMMEMEGHINIYFLLTTLVITLVLNLLT